MFYKMSFELLLLFVCLVYTVWLTQRVEKPSKKADSLDDGQVEQRCSAYGQGERETVAVANRACPFNVAHPLRTFENAKRLSRVIVYLVSLKTFQSRHNGDFPELIGGAAATVVNMAEGEISATENCDVEVKRCTKFSIDSLLSSGEENRQKRRKEVFRSGERYVGHSDSLGGCLEYGVCRPGPSSEGDRAECDEDVEVVKKESEVGSTTDDFYQRNFSEETLEQLAVALEEQ
ncbi:hypothetical protein NQ317_018907 [Molorchus minor]|uniref:Uncharacterized protein n=1 Tax=Molorchus minor TaxID=1323400 RepID=A0ABQ9JN26_9CUCU|nr:hypothetical protein NQ317_018907 [Molorchus minor]